MLQDNSWLDRILDPLARKLDDWIAMMSTRDFWAIVAVGSTLVGFLIAALIILTNFNIMRMRSCFNASNMNAYLMFNALLFFVFAGMMAMGEVFNYFDNKKRGIPHNRKSIIWLVIVTTSMGTAGLVMLKISC